MRAMLLANAIPLLGGAIALGLVGAGVALTSFLAAVGGVSLGLGLGGGDI